VAVHDRHLLGQHALARGPCLRAEVGVVGVEAGVGAGVEAQVAHRPGRERHEEAVDGVDLRGAVGEVQEAAGLDDAAEALGRVPPRQARDAARTHRADDRDVRVREPPAQEVGEVGAEDLGVLVEQDERLEVVPVAHGVEHLVVRGEDRRGVLGLDDEVVRRAHAREAREADRPELLRVPDAHRVGDHARHDRIRCRRLLLGLSHVR
jgi:hypothetical protein